MAEGQDDNFANFLAHHWVSNAKKGERPGGVFDTLAYRHGDEVLSYQNLRKDLTALAKAARGD